MSNNSKKYQIFVSSTYTDLIEARNRVLKVILDLYHFPVGMEMFGADDSEQWDFINDTIKVSDYYILILGHRYGSLDSDGIGFTEKEYDYAKSLGIPIISFIRSSNVSTSPHERETDVEKNQKLELFRQKATGGKLCKFWDSLEELEREVAVSLPKSISRHPRVGWVRADQLATPELTQEIVKLNEENRKLRDENERFKELYNSRNPDITVTINGLDNLSFSISGVPKRLLLSKIEPIKSTDISTHLLEFINESEIQSYNNDLPNDEGIEQHNKSVNNLFLMDNFLSLLDIIIFNKGSSKANDIRIDMRFPDFVQVIESNKYSDDLDKLGKKLESKKIIIKESPLLIAEEKYRKKNIKRIHDFDILSPLNFSNSSSVGKLMMQSNMQHNIRMASKSIRIANVNYRIDCKDNNISVWLKSLLQTRKSHFEDEISIIPLEEGNGFVEITVICEEYSEAVNLSIPINVSKG